MAEFVLDGVENMMRKGENACDQHFLLFPHCFQYAFFQGLCKPGTVL